MSGILALTLAISLASCAGLPKKPIDATTGQEMTADQIASVAAKELSAQVMFWHAQIKAILDDPLTTDETRQRLYENVTPSIDRAKRLAASYAALVSAWRNTGQMPQDIYEREAAIRSLLTSVATAFYRR